MHQFICMLGFLYIYYFHLKDISIVFMHLVFLNLYYYNIYIIIEPLFLNHYYHHVETFKFLCQRYIESNSCQRLGDFSSDLLYNDSFKCMINMTCAFRLCEEFVIVLLCDYLLQLKLSSRTRLHENRKSREILISTAYVNVNVKVNVKVGKFLIVY